MPSPKVWFITGASRGFGREWTIAALERGDRSPPPPATPRPSTTSSTRYGDAVLPLQLDVTDRDADFAAVAAGARALRPPRRRRQQRRLRPLRHGRGADRGRAPRPARDQRLRRRCGSPRPRCRSCASRAVGPHHPGVLHRRDQRLPGHRRLPRVQVGARGLQPVARPGGRRLRHPRDPRRARRLLHRLVRSVGPAQRRDRRLRRGPHEASENRTQRRGSPGDPTATGAAILKVVDADQPPLRVFFGKAPLGIATKDYESRLATWNDWQPVSLEAQG